MIHSISIAFEQDFFLRAILIVTVLAMVFPLYGNIIIIRQEANIAHTFAHIGLLGIAIGLRFNRSIELSILGGIVATVFFLYIMGSGKSNNHVVNNEIGAQLGLVGAILLVSQMSGYKADIASYLFGDILLLGQKDVYSVIGITIICFFIYMLFWKKWYALSIHYSLAKSKNISARLSYFIYLVALGLLIGGAMKIIGVLLVSAFLILPSNIGKNLASNRKQRNRISSIVGMIASIVAICLSWYRDMPSGASIIAMMIIIFICTSLIIKK